MVFNNNENYLINYLNLLIHGICKALDDFQKVRYVQLNKDWVLANIHSDFSFGKEIDQ